MLYTVDKNDIILRDYDDFSLIYNLKTNRYAKINEVASDIIKYVQKNQFASDEDIVNHIKRVYDIEEDIHTDIMVFLHDLYNQRIFINPDKNLTFEGQDNSSDDLETEILHYMTEKRILFSATFEMTYRCNEHCIHCYAYDGQFNRDILLNEKIKETIDELYDLNCFHLVFTGGDPFMRKNFIDIYEYARKKNFSVDIYTNGLILSENDDMFNRIVSQNPKGIYISLYSSDSEVHDAITRIKGSWEKTVNAIKKLKKSGISVILNILVMKSNFCTLKETIAFAEKLGVVYRVGWIITETNVGGSEPLQYRIDDERQAIELFESIRTKEERERQNTHVSLDDYVCGAGIISITITPNGDLKPCVSLNRTFGNIKDDRVKDVFYGKDMTSFVCGIKWKNTEKCKDCEHMEYCPHCVANSYNQEKNVLYPNDEDCFFAKCMSKTFK